MLFRRRWPGGLGYLVFRSRITGVYFALITQALALIVSILFIGQQPYTGGTNGITNYTTIFGFSINAPTTQAVLYYATLATLALTYLLCAWLIASRFGRLLVAMRDDENRVRFSGYNPAALKTIVLCPFGRHSRGSRCPVHAPGRHHFADHDGNSAFHRDCHLGGGRRPRRTAGRHRRGHPGKRGQERTERVLPAIWQYFLGLLFIGAVLVFPSGIMGLLRGEGWRRPEWFSTERLPGFAGPGSAGSEEMIGRRARQIFQTPASHATNGAGSGLPTTGLSCPSKS